MSDPIKIGDTLWGGEYGRPERWRSLQVTGETKQSWLLGGPSMFAFVKVNKKTMLEHVPNFSPIQWFTSDGRIGEEFVRKNRHLIAQSVYNVRDADVLCEIARLTGFKG